MFNRNSTRLRDQQSGREHSEAKVVGEAPGILTLNETARLLEAASTGILPYLAIGAFAGLRRAELERLDWLDVHFDSDLFPAPGRLLEHFSPAGQARTPA
jgi:integrase